MQSAELLGAVFRSVFSVMYTLFKTYRCEPHDFAFQIRSLAMSTVQKSENTEDIVLTGLFPSRKVLRQHLKAARKLPQESSIKSTDMVEDVENTVLYECCVCADNFRFKDGVAPCEEHFFCKECLVKSFKVALEDNDAFPPKCCTPLQRSFVEHILTPEIIEAYKAKVKEYYTPRVVRVYCSNSDCHVFLPKEYSTTATCGSRLLIVTVERTHV